MTSLLATIRAAISAPVNDPAQADEPGAEASTIEAPVGAKSEEGIMPNAETATGAVINAGISEADHQAAIATAEATGRETGAKAANERIGAVLGAEGIKGDGKRMSAALDLALKSPGMSADDVVSFVTGNVGAAAQTKAAGYEQQRLASAGLTQAGGPAGSPASANTNLNPSAVYQARREAVKGS